MDISQFGGAKSAEKILEGAPPLPLTPDVYVDPPPTQYLANRPMPSKMARLKEVALKLHKEIEEGNLESAKSTSNYLQGFLDSLD